MVMATLPVDLCICNARHQRRPSGQLAEPPEDKAISKSHGHGQLSDIHGRQKETRVDCVPNGQEVRIAEVVHENVKRILIHGIV